MWYTLLFEMVICVTSRRLLTQMVPYEFHLVLRHHVWAFYCIKYIWYIDFIQLWLFKSMVSKNASLKQDSNMWNILFIKVECTLSFNVSYHQNIPVGTVWPFQVHIRIHVHRYLDKKIQKVTCILFFLSTQQINISLCMIHFQTEYTQ